jgi:hypothetical protein
VTTGQTGAFIWKKDTVTFSILAGQVGMPLEFRLGMREQQAEIDALVLNLSSSLTNAELDDLFAVLPGDYNGDGQVDAADYIVWRKTFGQNVPQWSGADGSGDGVVNEDDYQAWSANFGPSSAGSGALATAPVPEPSTIAMVFVALAAFYFPRSRLVLDSIVKERQ